MTRPEARPAGPSRIKVSLSEGDLGELLEALFEMRDSTGEEAGDLEERLTTARHKLRQAKRGQ